MKQEEKLKKLEEIASQLEEDLQTEVLAKGRIERTLNQKKKELQEYTLTWRREKAQMKERSEEDAMNMKIDYEKKVSNLKLENMGL